MGTIALWKLENKKGKFLKYKNLLFHSKRNPSTITWIKKPPTHLLNTYFMLEIKANINVYNFFLGMFKRKCFLTDFVKIDVKIFLNNNIDPFKNIYF
jgi:hypothetical protein